MADSTTSDETLEARIDSMIQEFSSLRDRLSPQAGSDALDRVTTDLAEFPFRLHDTRRRGYLFQSDLEVRIEALGEEWPLIQAQVQSEIRKRSQRLLSRALGIDGQLRQLESYRNHSISQPPTQMTSVEQGLRRLEDEIDVELRAVREIFDVQTQQVQELGRRIQHLEWMMDEFTMATFGLYQDEAVVEGIQAQQFFEDEGGPKGVLFLTDQRILFEQKEEVVVKRRFLIFTEKDTVRKLLWEVPIGFVMHAEEEREGRFVFKKDYLELTFGPGAPLVDARLRLRIDPEDWLSLFGRVRTGEIDTERIYAEEVATDPEKSVQIPAQCPGCAAALPQNVVRGQRIVVCPCCGREIAL